MLNIGPGHEVGMVIVSVFQKIHKYISLNQINILLICSVSEKHEEKLLGYIFMFSARFRGFLPVQPESWAPGSRPSEVQKHISLICFFLNV